MLIHRAVLSTMCLSVCVYVCDPSRCSVDRSLACPGHSKQTKVGFNLIMAERRPP